MRAFFAPLPFAPSRPFRAFTHTHTHTRIVASSRPFSALGLPRPKPFLKFEFRKPILILKSEFRI